LTRFDPQTGESGVLLGDSLVRGLQVQMRRIMSDSVEGLSGSFRALADIGLKTQRDGTLELDSTRLAAAIEADPAAVARVFGAGGTATDSLVDYVSAGPAAQPGRFPLTVDALASQGRYVGQAVSGFPLMIDADNDTLSVQVDGVDSGTITLTQGTYANGVELAAELQGSINADARLEAAGASVSVTFVGDHFELTSNLFGSVSDVRITAADTTTDVTLGMGAGIGTSTAGTDVRGALGSLEASGVGRLLTGTGTANGLTVEIRGGVLGARGMVEYSRGVADRLYGLMDTYLGEESGLADQLESLDTRKNAISEERKELDAHLGRLEENLRARFSALDVLVAELTRTSDFLTAQLDQLPGVNRNRR
jgi:flagellar hook-associated protein 2